jgi:alpha-beta hydrolase superfamily lysophospholipase
MEHPPLQQRSGRPDRHAPPAQLHPHYSQPNYPHYASVNITVPKNKYKARVDYKEVEKPKKVKQSYAVANAQSKIKDHVAYFKNMSKNRRNRAIFNKDPQIFAKPHPSEKITIDEPVMRRDSFN